MSSVWQFFLPFDFSVLSSVLLMQSSCSGPRDLKEFTSAAVVDFMASNYIEDDRHRECPICAYLSAPSSGVVRVIGQIKRFKTWATMATHLTKAGEHPMFSHEDRWAILGTQLLRR